MTAPSYVDPIAVERAIKGHAVRLTRRETWAAIDLLDVNGRSAHGIAKRLGIAQRTVTRRRAARRATDPGAQRR